jgi:hypothetical protein
VSRHTDADETLDVEVPSHPVGDVERAVRASIKDAALDDRDGAAAELAASLARAVDLAHGRRDPYAVATVGRELRETLIRLRLDPTSRLGNDAGNVATWLERISNPTGPVE